MNHFYAYGIYLTLKVSEVQRNRIHICGTGIEKQAALNILTGSCSTFACPMLAIGTCRSGATFHLDIPSEVFHSPVEHICILFRLFITSL
ncbi:hypothetical protein [Clostridium chromiireducens]|uniref:hypothetical protein n=1 Tax=Clostridium chromiireducens TaxID=225345 RepID=UPI0009A53FC2|nr:hypothetical protein [Clostridium chromiireducens]